MCFCDASKFASLSWPRRAPNGSNRVRASKTDWICSCQAADTIQRRCEAPACCAPRLWPAPQKEASRRSWTDKEDELILHGNRAVAEKNVLDWFACVLTELYFLSSSDATYPSCHQTGSFQIWGSHLRRTSFAFIWRSSSRRKIAEGSQIGFRFDFKGRQGEIGSSEAQTANHEPQRTSSSARQRHKCWPAKHEGTKCFIAL